MLEIIGTLIAGIFAGSAAIFGYFNKDKKALLKKISSLEKKLECCNELREQFKLDAQLALKELDMLTTLRQTEEDDEDDNE